MYRLQNGFVKEVSNVSEKDFSKYFIPPSLKDAKKRGKEDIQVVVSDPIPEDMKTVGIGKKYLIRTYGCQMNEHDTEIIAGLLQTMGYTETDIEEETDVMLFNTCAIRENAEDKVFGEIGRIKRIKRQKPDMILGVCGCMSQEESVVNRILRSYPQVDLIFGTHNVHRLPALLKEAIFSK
ncbi:MAG: tRNA (N6-isopentenyl adenosine(37)-C2)-methylthiotransferase MiaB, partial [Bacilli bacterium]